MMTIEQWLSASELRECLIRRSYGLVRVSLTDENRYVTNASGHTRDEAEEKALCLYEREQIEARAQMDADDAAFLAELERSA